MYNFILKTVATDCVANFGVRLDYVKVNMPAYFIQIFLIEVNINLWL